MKIYNLFNIAPKSLSNFNALSGSDQTKVGAFINGQSLLSFPVASGLTVGLWQLFKILIPIQGKSSWTAVIIALVIGMVIYFISSSDPALKLTKRDKIIAFIIAVINCLVLAMAALGVNAVFV